MNRAVGRRVLFENRPDIRHFLALAACAVRAGLVEIHSFVIMPTHFHLLVRSPVGRLSTTMQVIEQSYAVYFNRVHERDGHLVQGRFRSKPVRSDAYRRMLPPYIDYNPVKARLVDEPADYPYGSARHYARAKGPPWLSRWWIESLVQKVSMRERYSPEAYRVTVGARPRRAQHRLVEARLAGRSGEDALDDLVGTMPSDVRSWLERRARMADGLSLGPPLVDPESVAKAVERCVPEGRFVRPHGRARGARTLVHAVLLRMLARLNAAAISRRLGVAPSTVTAAFSGHSELIDGDPDYALDLAKVACAAIEECHGPAVGPRCRRFVEP
jgi:REP element-mobilizing transposase RayT